MSRMVRFLIVTLTLGRIKWLMRLTWLWRFIVFLGITSWLARMLRRAAGLDKKPSTEVDSAWADALRYTPPPTTANAAAEAVSSAAPAAEPQTVPSDTEVSEATSEVTGMTADGSMETITIHEVDVAGDTESIVRIEDEAGHVETLVTGVPAGEIDLANLGASATDASEPVAEETPLEPLADLAGEPAPEIVEVEIELIEPPAPAGDIESEAAAEVSELIETLEAAEPEPEPAPEPPKRKRSAKTEPAPPVVEEPLTPDSEDANPDLLVDPDWVRGDGSHDCPESHPIKAKANSMIYYGPESGHYDRTIPDVCFASEADAEAAGYRPPRR